MTFFRPFPVCLFFLLCTGALPSARADSNDAGPAQQLTPMVISESPSAADKFQLPQVAESVTARRMVESINVLDTEDAVKYLPSVFLRKRNHGDTQAVLATRTWGVSSSARSLIYADGILLSALIANNNSIGGPRWGFVAPAEIERIDMMYGPFAAAHPGNAMGAVMEITTRMPETFEANVAQTFAWQNFSHYGTHDTYATTQTAVSGGGQIGPLSLWLSANHQDSHSQPLNYVTSATFPAGTTGGFRESNKLGQPAHVLGATGLQHSRGTNAKLKLAYDFSRTLRLAYTLGLWRNDLDASAETYLHDASGAPTFAGLTAFASGVFTHEQRHSTHGASLRSDTHGAFDVEASAAYYRMDRDEQRFPTTASATGTSFGRAGRAVVLGGTAWTTFDLKLNWRTDLVGRAGERHARHVVTFGVHDDRYSLYNPTFTTADWRIGELRTSVATEGDGKTRTQAAWLQHLWRLTPAMRLTLGARYEAWRAYDGLNINGATRVRQPAVRDRALSPKGTFAWDLDSRWQVSASLAQAYRFPTAAELYQLVSTGTTFTAPTPNLKPDDVLAAELKLERKLATGRVRLSLFQDDVRDAIIAQFNPLGPGSPALFSFLSNVDHVRSRGAELVLERNNMLVRGLELQGSVTFVSARTVALSGRASAAAAPGSAIGKRLPNIPEWRGALVATYRTGNRWAFTLAGRYSGMLYTTLDNADVNPNTWQGFAPWFVADARVHGQFDRHWSASLGADNLLNRKYFLFHPFPQRSFVTEVKYAF